MNAFRIKVYIVSDSRRSSLFHVSLVVHKSLLLERREMVFMQLSLLFDRSLLSHVNESSSLHCIDRSVRLMMRVISFIQVNNEYNDS